MAEIMYQRERERQFYGYGENNEYLAGNNSNRTKSDDRDGMNGSSKYFDSRSGGGRSGRFTSDFNSDFTYSNSQSQIGRKKLNIHALEYLESRKKYEGKNNSAGSSGENSMRVVDRKDDYNRGGFTPDDEEDGYSYSDLSDLDRNCDGYSKDHDNNNELNSVYSFVTRASEIQLPSSQASEFSEGELLRMQFSRDFGRDIPREDPIF